MMRSEREIDRIRSIMTLANPVPGDAREGSWPDPPGNEAYERLLALSSMSSAGPGLPEPAEPARSRMQRRGAPRTWSPRRLLAPAAAAAAVAAVLAVLAGVVIVRDGTAGPAAAGPPPAAGHGIPRYYVTVDGFTPHVMARVHDSLTGQVVSSVKVPDAADVTPTITAARNDRMFLIASAGLTSEDQNATRLFALRIAAGGRSVTLTKLPVVLLPVATKDAIDGMALSPDGARLAVAIQIATSGFRPRAEIAVFSLHGGPTRTWTAPRDAAMPWDPAWVDSGRRLAFLWWDHIKGPVSNFTARTQVRELDTSAPGGSLLASRVLAAGGGKLGFIGTAFAAPGGRAIIASAYRNVAAAGKSGTATVRLVTFSGSTGQLLSVLSSRAVHYRGPDQRDAADLSCEIAAVDRTARHALLTCPQFGRLDNGRFTRLPGSGGIFGVTVAW